MKTPRDILLSRHRDVEPKLDRMWVRITARPATAPYRLFPTLWRELFWPCRPVWAGLACVWALIAVLNLASREPTMQVASKAEPPPSRAEIQALIEQRRLLTQLIDPMPAASDKHESEPLGPRSEKAPRALAA